MSDRMQILINVLDKIKKEISPISSCTTEDGMMHWKRQRNVSHPIIR